MYGGSVLLQDAHLDKIKEMRGYRDDRGQLDKVKGIWV